MVARFAAGTSARMDAVLQEKDRTDFVRRAVEREIERLERKGGKRRRG